MTTTTMNTNIQREAEKKAKENQAKVHTRCSSCSQTSDHAENNDPLDLIKYRKQQKKQNGVKVQRRIKERIKLLKLLLREMPKQLVMPH